MATHIQPKTPSATYFFTARLVEPNSSLLVEKVELLHQVIRLALQNHPFEIDAIVVLPAAIQTIWKLPEGDVDYNKRWRFLQSTFSRTLPIAGDHTSVQRLRKEKGIWQQKLWAHRIISVQDLALHRHLIHTAPVQAGLVTNPSDWARTSFHRYLADRQKIPDTGRPVRFSAANLKTKPSPV